MNASPTPEGTAPARSLRVLVIEDNPDAAESLRILLELGGHRVGVAHDGDSALSLAGSLEPEVVLCDIGLPGAVDGYEIARTLKREGANRKCYLIALTGFDREEDRALALEAGFDAHFPKPVDLARLKSLISSLSP